MFRKLEGWYPPERERQETTKNNDSGEANYQKEITDDTRYTGRVLAASFWRIGDILMQSAIASNSSQFSWYLNWCSSNVFWHTNRVIIVDFHSNASTDFLCHSSINHPETYVLESC